MRFPFLRRGRERNREGEEPQSSETVPDDDGDVGVTPPEPDTLPEEPDVDAPGRG
jgi:hypothetical protein